MASVLPQLRVMVLNAENLFLLSDQELTPEHLKLDAGQWNKLSTSVFVNKPIEKARELAKIITSESPDLVLLCEVGGLESLQNFNRLFLHDTYSPVLIEGNSNRNIDVGYLIKKNPPFYFDVISNKNRPIHFLYPHERQNNATHSHKFSRDAVELHLFQHDRERPFLIFVLTHLKSRLDPDNIDPSGSERRQAELKTLIEVYQELELKFQDQVPIVLAGDFNGNARRNEADPEFSDLYQKTNLRDVCDLAQLSAEDSATYYQVGKSSRPEGRQIDYCFLPPKLAPHLDPKSVTVYRYRDNMGLPLDPPTTLDAKAALPSDHYPLIFNLKDIPLR
ncbi:MAG: hypothetical protein COT73_07235 [Bdellovibrio sp. CG10_big_fil_rev_8_21_14_0_10_47_8]|nr:MAG: hypothetical protein COT73_07235 [Bdellovibrio sp. CG10_big_fil_rev_8_21_14_0_10_47_8]